MLWPQPTSRQRQQLWRRLCGQLWQGAGQAQAAVGATAVRLLGSAADDVVNTGPQAVVAALRARPEAPCRGLPNLINLTASLAKLTLLDSLRKQGGFPDRQLSRTTLQLEDCADVLLRSVGNCAEDLWEATER